VERALAKEAAEMEAAARAVAAKEEKG